MRIFTLTADKMDGCGERVIKVVDTLDNLAEEAAAYISRVLNEAVESKGRALLALSGGSTPFPLYEKLSLPKWSSQIPWSNILVFWGDERLVPADHEESNYFQSWNRLLSHVPVPGENLHRVNSHLPAGEAARDYATRLKQYALAGSELPVFDLILLGLGEDGHTASLFPGVPSDGEEEEMVIAVTSHYNNRPAARITFTPSLINAARHVCFMVSGRGKADAAARTICGEFDPLKYPAQRINPVGGRVVWMMDQEAASLLKAQGNCL